MKKNPHELTINTLQRLGYWLERDGASRIIMAFPTVRELRKQHLPDHLKVLSKKRRGERKVVRGRRRYNDQRLRIAKWPEDRLDENALPFVACCTRGSVDLNIADYVLQIKAGDWVVFPAGIPKQDGSKPHFHRDPTGRSGDVLWIYSGITRYDGLTLSQCHSEGKMHYNYQESSCRINDPFLARLFDGFCNEMLDKRRPGIARQLLSLVLSLLHSEVAAGNIEQEVLQVPRAKVGNINDPITEALAYIDENLHRRLTIDKVAKQVLVSPATFTRHFKAKTGETFGQYQKRRRLELAELLLMTTNFTVLNVCDRIGLNYGQMRNLFLEKHGCTPSVFREDAAKNEYQKN